MPKIMTTATLALTLCLASQAQTPETRKLEFEAASVKSVPAPTGFRFSFAPDTGSGGPGTSDPGMFRCGNCTLASLIGKAFHLQEFQFPGRASLPGGNFEISAKIPPATTEEEFQTMLQNLLKERFALACHFDEKTMAGYHLVVAKGGPKLKESTGAEMPRSNNTWGKGEAHSHAGAMNFNGTARYQGTQRTIADLVKILSDQLGRPVDDQTGLTGKYDIALNWTNESTGGSQAHGPEPEHNGHAAPAASADPSGPGLFQALQSQLGLKLVPGDKFPTRIFIVDHVEKTPTSN